MTEKNFCPKGLLLLILTVVSLGLAAQTVTLTFTAKDAGNHYVQLNRVIITNLTKSWQETIYWPDTVMQMQNGTGIDDHTQNGGFSLSQNNPNPFSGITDVTLTAVEDGPVSMEISDVNGRIVETQNFASLPPGTHQFRITLAVAGTYVLTARQNGETSSIKMICNGGGGANTIDHLGEVQTLTYVLKSSTNNPFNFGDMMEYVGYATINGTMEESQHITQAQGSSQTFILEFPVTDHQLPIVTTHAVTNVTNNSATCGGTINSDGGATVTARGICWSANQYPTISGLHTTNGSGTGSFTSNMTNLTPNITYYVRAYATNAAGTAYGQQEIFNTNADLPTVTTTTPTNITTTMATLWGNVSSDGGSTVTERGFQIYWYNPNYNSTTITCGSGTGNFSSNFTSLTPGATYHVKAYATNAAGTAYGQTLSFTTLANLAEVTTNTVTNVTTTTATCGGNVISDGGGAVTARGVCWSTSQNPTVSGNHTTDGSGTGNFTSSITGLTAGTTYYVRAYATNSAGTAYGQQQSFAPASAPTVTTDAVSNITCNSAQCTSTVTSDNGSPVTARGVCWIVSTQYIPTVYDNHTTDGTGTGSFTSNMNFSDQSYAGMTIRVRAYATNSAGTSYGEVHTFTTPIFPTVTTNANVTSITDTTAVCGGNVTSDGGADITNRGIVWSTSNNPSLQNCTNCHSVSAGSGTGSFTANLTNLLSLTTYYVRTYATNCQGTSYGDVRSFTTTGAFSCGTSVVSDYDGNTYNTIQIGSQCWMKENLRARHYADGTPIVYELYNGDSQTISTSSPYFYYPSNFSYYDGYLYNWKAATRYDVGSTTNPSGIQGACPTGWHLPSKDEWLQLADYVSDAGIYSCDNSRRNIAKSLSQSWSSSDTCAVAVNATGFSARKCGRYNGGSSATGYNNYALFCSSTINSSYDVEAFDLTGFSQYGYSKGNGLSVRCVSDESVGSPVTLRPYTTDFSGNDWTLNNGSCTNFWYAGYYSGTGHNALYVTSNYQNNANYSITTSSTVMAEKTFAMPSDDSIHVEFDVQVGGESSFDYLKVFLAPATITFTPGSSHNAQSQKDYANYAVNFSNFKSQTTGLGSYPYIFNLTNGNTVHISVNVANPTPNGLAKFVFLWRNDNSSGTQPGAVISNFSIGMRECPGLSTITDYDGNLYTTVKLGDQCWMRENMRSTHYSDGTYIPTDTTTSTSEAYRYAPNNNPDNVPAYGYLYNWRAAMGGTPSVGEIPSSVQGVCPVGWHLPTSAEWDQLKDYLSSQSAYYCNSYNNTSKAMAHWEAWNGGGSTCSVCSQSANNNASGLGIRPAGYFNGEYSDFGEQAELWLPERNTSSYYLNCYSKALVCSSTSLQSGSSSNAGATGSNTGAMGKSVRCVLGAAAPTVKTSVFYGTSSTSAEGGGIVISDGGAALTARGVCWSTSHNPTVSGSHTNDGTSTGTFTSNLTGLTPSTTYYVRAYATNSYGTFYGDEVSVTTSHNDTDGQPCPTAVTVTDADNNIYPTVQLGTQCWMAENLRTTHYANGTYIAYGDGINSTTEAYRYYPYEASINLYPGGFLYNWTAVMGGAAASSANPSGVQGICPDGWHVPSAAEWTQLVNYVKSQSVYSFGYSHDVADALASETGWKPSNAVGTPGNHCDTVLRTGFSAVPSSTGSFDQSGGVSAYFWSSTEGSSSSKVTTRDLYYSSKGMSESTSSGKGNYMSVRCIKNASGGSSSLGVTTAAVTNIMNSSAICGGRVYTSNASGITARGVCWSTTPHPTISDNHTTDGSGTGSFTSTMTNIYANRIYYVRAYVTSSTGTVYGNELSFSKIDTNYDTQPCLGTANVDNTYNTVQIGTQCWLKENVRSTNYTNGTPIALGSSLSDTTAYYYPGNDPYNKYAFGLLYNWMAAVGNDVTNIATDMPVQGICPVGWHLPKKYEWADLIQYVNSQAQYMSAGSLAKALASKTGWNNCIGCPGQDPSTNNTTGFSALPANYRDNTNSYSNSTGNFACFWSCSPSDNDNNKSYFNLSQVSTTNRQYGLSVRCLRNASNSGSGTEQPVSVATYTPIEITTTSAILSGTVFNPENVTVSAQGFQWKEASANAYTTVNVAGNSLTYSLTGLTSDNSYTYRAFVSTAQGILYGPYVTFTTMPVPGAPCPNTPTVTDYDGNYYNTVKIGNQCWMKENLRTTHYANGDEVPIGSSTSNTVAYRYNPNNNANNVATYGYLYNWIAVMHGAASSSVNPSGVQGICPTGWHVPSYAEWMQLSNYVNSIPDFVCDNNNNYVAKALSATTGWASNSTACAVGNNPSDNNATGFGALPAGKYSSPYNFGTSAYYWCTGNNIRILYSSATLNQNSNDVNPGYSVRCVRDACCSEPPITVSTGAATSINHMSAILNGAVINPENTTITALGFQWKTTSGGIYTTDYTQDTSFSYSLIHLQPENSYLYRAFVNTEQGCSVYGPEVQFSTLPTPTCPGTPTITDYDGNNYNTVQIGNQCWMKENLRTTHFTNGEEIPVGFSSSNTIAYRYSPNNDTSNVTTYGYLYNWIAVMHGENSSGANPSGVQGICPLGWHVPSNAEWTQLIDFVSNVPDYVCSSYSNAIAKALASNIGWNTNTATCTVGNDLSVNNLTGFSAMPASSYNGFYNQLGSSAVYWSTQTRRYSLASYSYSVTQYDGDTSRGCSVRCIRD